mmetsp:Transcript_21416/g.68394  ORF Transcript_21416/g.68394 Transcript_21416/m.68394 type:complete len:360 (+) Transcript_21416:50-1129(+)
MVSIRSDWLYAIEPIACLPIAHWYVFRGDWLWCGYGISPAHTPRMVSGSISRCEYGAARGGVARSSASRTAISAEFSSLTSRYSTMPSLTKSANSRLPAASSSMCRCSRRMRPLSTTSSGRQTRPLSDAMLTQRWVGCSCTDTNSRSTAARRSWRIVSRSWSGRRCTPRISPLRNTRCAPRVYRSSAQSKCKSSTPRLKQRRRIGSSSSSVVTWAERARFLTSPHASPSGVSDGQSMPHCEGCSERGPDTFRVFSNCDMMRVIMPSAEMKERRESTCVTPERSILKRLTDQFPDEMAETKPLVRMSSRTIRVMSHSSRFVDTFDSSCVARRRSSAHSFLKRSSKRRERSCPASSSRLLP